MSQIDWKEVVREYRYIHEKFKDPYKICVAAHKAVVELEKEFLNMERKNKQLINTIELMDKETHKQRNDLQVAHLALAEAYATFKQLENNPTPSLLDLGSIDSWLNTFNELYPQMQPKEDAPATSHHGNK